MTDTINIYGIDFTPAAAANIEEAEVSVRRDLYSLRMGHETREQLLKHCLFGADHDRVQGWHNYVAALVAAIP